MVPGIYNAEMTSCHGVGADFEDNVTCYRVSEMGGDSWLVMVGNLA